MTLRSLALAFALLAVVAALLPAAGAAVTGPLQATIDGPSALAPTQTAQYNITITGGPTVNATYSLNYYVTGTGNISGGSPLQTSPGALSGNKTIYHLNITAPTAEQTITLTVQVTASSKGGPSENTTATYVVTVVKGIILTATFHNDGSTAALNVTIRWAIDGNLIGTSLVRQIAANSDATVTYTYLPVGLAPGEHTLTVSADLDHDGIINPARGEVYTTTIFYSQVEQPALGWSILLGIGVFVPVFLGVVALRRRGER